MSTIRIVSMFAFVVLSGWLYASKLASSPPRAEELRLASESHALANRGWRDRQRRFMPLFVEASDDTWLEPLPVYAALMTAKVTDSPVNQVRLASVLMGTLDVVLVYVLAARLFDRRAPAFLAALLLLLTPAHFTYSRYATTDGVWQVPFILIWLIALDRSLDERSRRPRLMFALAGAAVAASAYSQPSAALMVPAFGLISVLAIDHANQPFWIAVRSASIGFVVALFPLMLWFTFHPRTYAGTFGGWFLHPAHIRDPTGWLKTSTNWLTLTVCSDVYWDFFDPSHLFLNEQAPAVAGVFLSPLFVLIAVGAREALRLGAHVREGRATIFRIVFLGFVIAPVAAATFKEPRAVQRALVIVPFGVLLATLGAQTLWTYNARLSRVLAVLLIVAALAQFAVYYRGVLM